MELLAGEPVKVRIGKRPALAEDVAVRAVKVTGDDNLVRADQVRYVAVPIGVVVRVGTGIANSKLTIVRTSQEAADAACVLQAAAQVFAEQAKGAGVKVNIKKVDSGVFYGQDYLTYTFAQDYWNTRNYLMQAALGEFPRAPLNETHWKNDKWLAIVQEAFRTVDETKRNKLVSDALTIEYDEGASILWAFRDLLDGYSGKLGGVKPDKSGSALGSYRFNVVYFK